MNKNLLGKVLLIFVMVLITVIGCTEPEAPVPPVPSIAFEKESIRLPIEGSEILSYKVSPSGFDAGTVIWTSSDETVATVEDGVVHALAAGTTTIKVETSNGLKAECIVSVCNMRAALMEDVARIKLIPGHTSVLYAGQPEVPNNCLFAYSSKEVKDKASENLINMMVEMMAFTFEELEDSHYYSDGDKFYIICNIKMNTLDENNPGTPFEPNYIPTPAEVYITQKPEGNWVISGGDYLGSGFEWYLNGVFPYEGMYGGIKLPENGKVISSGLNHKKEKMLFLVEYSMTDSEFNEYKELLGESIAFSDYNDGVSTAWYDNGEKGYQWQRLNDNTMAIIIMPSEKNKGN